jgi:hypothetical protein
LSTPLTQAADSIIPKTQCLGCDQHNTSIAEPDGEFHLPRIVCHDCGVWRFEGEVWTASMIALCGGEPEGGCSEPPYEDDEPDMIAPSSNQAVDKRPAVEISTDRHLAIEPTIKALASDPEVYRRGDTLGIVAQEEAESVTLAGGIELAQTRGLSRFLPLSDTALSCVLTRNARFYQWRKDKSGEFKAADCHPPLWLIGAAATWGQWPGIRSLLSIASSPWIRSDGSIPNPGFDPATGTLYRPSVKLDSIPDKPTQADAKKASSELYFLVRQFPFATGYDWTVWLAGLFTAIQRPAIKGPVPGFAFNGNRAGTGKGLLVDSIGLLAFGHGIPTRTYPLDPAEAGKTKLSLGLAGIGAVHFDNLPEGGSYGGSEIDSALTSMTCEGRILGASRESGPVPIRPCWFLTGNNISPWKDAYRRWLPCNLETKLECPHERDDVEELDLRAYIAKHRAELLRHALIILRAHAVAGRPKFGTSTLGSFEEWDLNVRGAVWFATGNDCLTTQRKASSESPERLEKLALVEGWAKLPGGQDRGLTAADARAFVEEQPELYATLHSVFMAMSKDSKLASSHKIGLKIRAMGGQNHGGRRFEKNGESKGSVVWRSVPI